MPETQRLLIKRGARAALYSVATYSYRGLERLVFEVSITDTGTREFTCRECAYRYYERNVGAIQDVNHGMDRVAKWCDDERG